MPSRAPERETISGVGSAGASPSHALPAASACRILRRMGWTMTHRTLCALLVLASLGRAAEAGAPDADWPQWRGPTRDGISAESSGWPDGWPPKKLWEAKVGYGCTSPVIAGGRLYVMGWEGADRGNRTPGTDTVFCFDARTGRILWKQSYPCLYQGRVRAGDLGQYGGPSSTPTLDRDTGWLYTLSIDGHLHCWDATQQGKLVWKKGLYDAYKPRQRPDVGQGTRDYGYPTSPLVLGDLLLIEVNAAEGTVMAFDKKTGEQKWTSQYTDLAGHTGGLSPLTVEGVPCLAVLTLRNLVVLRLDQGHQGETVATAPWVTDFACNIPTPAVAGSRVLLTSGYNHSHASLFDVSMQGIRKLWTTERAHALTGSPVLFRGRAFLIGGSLQCVDLATGKLLWRGGGFGNGTCLVTAGDRKVIAWGRGSLALAEADAKEYRELHRTKRLLRGTCYPQVAFSNGVLACKDRNGTLIVFSLRPVLDTTPPEIVSAFAAGDPTTLRVQFSEPLDPATAENRANYSIDYGVTVHAARLGGDGSTVALTVSTLREGGTYTLRMSNILDRAKTPNRIAGGSKAEFRFTPIRRALDGLAALFTFQEGKGGVISGVSGGGAALTLKAADPSAVEWTRSGLRITKPTIIETAAPPAPLLEACRKSHEITIEAWIKPADTRQGGPARIISLSKDPYLRNVTLGQEKGGYDVRLRTTTTGENGMRPSLGAGGCVETTLSHVVYTRDKAGKARLYVDGVVKAERAIGGDLSNWDGGYRLALGNELTRDRPWLGTLRLVALYARALSQDEVAAHHRLGPDGAPAAKD